LKKNTSSALSKGYPAWNAMIHEAWKHPERYEKNYHRRSVIEGVFSAQPSNTGSDVK
jgi:transposase